MYPTDHLTFHAGRYVYLYNGLLDRIQIWLGEHEVKIIKWFTYLDSVEFALARFHLLLQCLVPTNTNFQQKIISFGLLLSYYTFISSVFILTNGLVFGGPISAKTVLILLNKVSRIAMLK